MSSEKSWLSETARSEHLPALWSSLGPALEPLRVLGVSLRLRVVLDTSTVLAELRWRVARRKKADARTALSEAICARVVVACAPPQMDQEVRANLDELALKTGVAQEAIWSSWLDFRREISIVEPRQVTNAATSYLRGRDPTDIAFVQLAESIGAAALLTADLDLLAADARAVNAREIVMDLRRYARAKTVELTIIGLGTFSVHLGIDALVSALNALPHLLRLTSRLPSWVHLALIGAAVWIFANESRREAAARILQGLRQWLGMFLEGFFEQIGALFSEAIEAHEQAELAAVQVGTRVRARKVLMRQEIYLACATATKPMSVGELEQAVRAQGYKSSAKTLAGAILRSLRADDRLAPVGPCWTLRIEEPARREP